jgi:Ca2+-binding EF-hand superfamily protein
MAADAIEAERGTEHMLEQAFPFFDQDGSGYITREEMINQFQELGGLLTKEEIEEFHDILDVDGNGVIDVHPENCLACL